MKIDGRLHCRQDELVAPEGAEERVAFQGGDELRFPGDDAGLRAAEQFVAAEADQIDAATKHLRRRRLVLDARNFFRADDGPAPEVFDERQPLLPGQLSDVFGRGRLDEAAHEEIAAMDFQNHRRLFRDGAGIIGERRLVRSPDLTQLGSAGLEDVGDAKSAADLHQLAAGDDDLLSLRRREVTEDQHERRGAVVNDRGGIGATQDREVVLEISGPPSALAARQVVFEVVVVRRDL